MHKNVQNFIGCDSEYSDSRVVIFGAPFDATTSYRPGARFASASVRGESYSIETYSPYQDADLEDAKVFDAGDLELPFGSPRRALEIIENQAGKIMDDGKIPLMIGGEHLVTLGAVRAAVSRHPDLRIIHFDAHADLRDSYLGEELNHSTVIRRCHDLLGGGRIYQYGIRSGERAEFEFARENTSMTRFGFTGLTETVQSLVGKPVYLTVDLDVLDPGEFPGTGTPEAGGVTFYLLLGAVLEVLKLDIVGLDLCELAPNLDPSGTSTSLTCKLLRETLLGLCAN